MSSKPSQIRTIDPFAEYNSNVANRLTRMLSGNENVLMSANSLALTQDSTSPLKVAVVQTGYVFKDDVFIEISANHEVDFRDSDNYINFDTGFDEAGYYYIVLEYTYVKSRPAPDVDIKILKPSQRGGYPVDSLLLVGVVRIVNNAGSFEIDSFHNFDPENTDNRREYVKSYVGTETNLPTHTQFRDQARMAYDSETDKFWLGYRDSWQEFGTGGSVINIDTTGTNVGEICYVDAAGAATPAIATAVDTGGDICVQSIGLAVDSSGKALTSGIAEDVPVETAITITTGDLLYLSASVAGTVTNVKTDSFYQVIGRAITSGSSAVPIDIIFTPKVLLSTAVVGQIAAVTGWTSSGGSYYADIDITLLDLISDFAVLSNFFDSGTDMQISPSDVEIINSGDTLRVWMAVNTLDVNYIVSTGGGGSIGAGGGGGGGDHSLLTNLSYAASGHSGFTPDPHDNAYHSAAYITSSGVTYNALLANGDIGTGATQVSQGNHTHSGLIVSGTVMLFGQASAPVGWTQKVTGFSNNAMIVVTTGSGAGQGGSADARSYNPAVSSVAVGNHNHSTGSHALTTAEMPVHSHPAPPGLFFTSYTGGGIVGSGDKAVPFSATGNAGSGVAHNHGSTGSAGTHNHTINYSNYAPYYFRIIAATKD